MSGARIVAVLLASVGVVACGGSDGGASQSAGANPGSQDTAAAHPSGAPEVEEAYQDRIDEAWRMAVAGEDPSTTCAALKGRTVVAEPGSADRALAACNLDIPVRYFLTYADRVEAGEKTCMELMTHVLITLPAMTMSTEGFRGLAREESADLNESDVAAAGAAILAGAAAAGGGASDLQGAIKDRLRERFAEVCPSETAAILR